MTKAKYLVKITNEKSACLGSQLIEILLAAKKNVENAVWYASDVDASVESTVISAFADCFPRKIGTTTDFIHFCQKIPQFLSGVFLVFTEDQGEYIKQAYITDDSNFKDIGNAVIEIRAFDTSYFEIYSNDFLLISEVANEFYGILEVNENNTKQFNVHQPVFNTKTIAKHFNLFKSNKSLEHTDVSCQNPKRKKKWINFETIAVSSSLWYQMTNANFLVRVTDKDCACLGAQLGTIIGTIHPFVEVATWYGADVTTNETASIRPDLQQCVAKKIGSTTDICDFAKEIDQFYSGVFFAFSYDKGPLLLSKYHTIETEFRDIEDEILEIRAVDTSYFEIYSNNFDLINKITTCFYGITEYNLNK